jgi:nucleotide-binding universal stress UspA family protein
MTANGSSTARIVVGVDGSEGSKNALRWAARLAAATGARIDAVTAWELTSLYGWSALSAVPALYSPQPEIEKSLNETVDEVFGANRPIDMRVRAFEGPAVKTLLAVSKGAVMLVVGSRGRGGFAGLLLGSVSAKVAEHASCPVLVVHGSGPGEFAGEQGHPAVAARPTEERE